MGDSPKEFVYRSDLNTSHEIGTDLMCYGSTMFPAFDGTLSTITAFLLRKLLAFAPAARRVLYTEIPDEKKREDILTSNPRYVSQGHSLEYKQMPIIWVLNGIIHSNDIWINHIIDPNRSWEPTGALHLLGFGYQTDQRRVEHVDLFSLSHGFLSRPAAYLNEFFALKGRG